MRECFVICITNLQIVLVLFILCAHLHLLQGPFIVRVTIEAYNCGSLDFPNPPYPDRLECPPPEHVSSPVTFWAILQKVRVRLCCQCHEGDS